MKRHWDIVNILSFIQNTEICIEHIFLSQLSRGSSCSRPVYNNQGF